MCGIVGYIGPRDATPIILNGLKRLEYRGYDSAGLAVLQNGKIEIRRDAGKLSRLTELVNGSPISGSPGVGHTRWATHGAPSARNAHPHLGATGRVVVVHNGIVENFLELRDELTSEGVEFNSDTDTEVIVHLVEHHLATGLDLVEAARRTFKQIQGAHGIVLLSADEPDKIVCARIGNAGGVVLGLGDGENFIASSFWNRVSWRWSRATPFGWKRSRARRSSPRSIPWRGTRCPPKKASTATSCKRKSTNRSVR
jgi:glucosamine--fructose-6-phosphate aminotransferase (isomerizing)